MRDELISLIRAGKLTPGTKLHHPSRVHERRSFEAQIVPGGIKFEGLIYETPSGAARAVTKASVDGWQFWKLPNGADLHSVRERSSRM